MMKGLLAGAAALLLLQSSPAEASEGSASEAATRNFISDHRMMIGGRPIRYKAAVQEFLLRDEKGTAAASVFVTSYIRTDRTDDEQRPVMFVFNGGPGSSSIWLHFGLVGPLRVDLDDPKRTPTVPPFPVVANNDSPLDVADIVLIDPPGTGYSRILPAGRPEQFYGTDPDARATAEIIHQWIRTHKRWNAPKYLFGESYGTERAAALARKLAGGPFETGSMEGLTLNGIILLGSGSGPSGDGRYATSLPTLAATACHFGLAPDGCTAESQAAAAAAFISEEYLAALWAGSALETARRDAVAERMSRLIGLPKATILNHDLRIGSDVFAKELLAGKGEEVGRYDTRYTLPVASSGGDPVSDDPAMGQYVPGFVMSFNKYLRETLGADLDQPYEVISFAAINERWGDGVASEASKADYATNIAVAMRRNPSLRVMVASGAYDLVTTMGAAEYDLVHAAVPLSRTRFNRYDSGHMVYLGKAPREKFAADIRAFVTQGGQPASHRP